MASSSGNGDASTVKLLLAAVTGATISFAITQYLATRHNRQRRRYDDDDDDVFGYFDDPTRRSKSSHPRQYRKSYIFEDNSISESGNSIVFPFNHEEKMRRLVAARAAVEEDNILPRQSVTVRVPATSANMGPGCKCYTLLHCRTEGRESGQTHCRRGDTHKLITISRWVSVFSPLAVCRLPTE